jgi:hypothetical protein
MFQSSQNKCKVEQLQYIWLAFDLIQSIIMKFPTNIEKCECMEYIYDQIIPITKFEILNMYSKNKVVNAIFGCIFLWCMILIYIN